MCKHQLIIEQDDFVDNPLDMCAEWEFTQFHDGHHAAAFFRPVSREEVSHQSMLPFVLVPVDAVMRKAFNQCRAWVVSCYRHGAEYWFLPQVRKENRGLPYLQHEEWDTTHVAGVLRWIGDSPDFPRRHADRLRWAHAALEEFNKWANGDVWSYQLLDEEGDPIDGCCGFYGTDAVVEEVRACHPELFCPAGCLLDDVQAGHEVRVLFG